MISLTPIDDLMLRYGRIPYKRGGDGFIGIDCVSLALRYYEEVVEFPLPKSPWAWRKVLTFGSEPFELHDLLFMMGKNRSKIIDHISVYAWPGNILHAVEGYNGVVCEPIERSRHTIIRIIRRKK